jgi:hypothetical protein
MSFIFVEVMNNERIQNDDDHQKYIEINTENILQKFINSNSHDSLIQSDHHIDTPTISSIFYSKDSALDLSDEYLNHSQLNQYTIFQEKSQSMKHSFLFKNFIT